MGFTTPPTSEGVPCPVDASQIISESSQQTTDASGNPTTEEFVTTKQGMYIGEEGKWIYYSDKKTKEMIGTMMETSVANEMYSFTQQCMQAQKDADQAADQ